MNLPCRRAADTGRRQHHPGVHPFTSLRSDLGSDAATHADRRTVSSRGQHLLRHWHETPNQKTIHPRLAVSNEHGRITGSATPSSVRVGPQARSREVRPYKGMAEHDYSQWRLDQGDNGAFSHRPRLKSRPPNGREAVLLPTSTWCWQFWCGNATTGPGRPVGRMKCWPG